MPGHVKRGKRAHVSPQVAPCRLRRFPPFQGRRPPRFVAWVGLSLDPSKLLKGDRSTPKPDSGVPATAAHIPALVPLGLPTAMFHWDLRVSRAMAARPLSQPPPPVSKTVVPLGGGGATAIFIWISECPEQWRPGRCPSHHRPYQKRWCRGGCRRPIFIGICGVPGHGGHVPCPHRFVGARRFGHARAVGRRW